jgi:hypothetical protein
LTGHKVSTEDSGCKNEEVLDFLVKEIYEFYLKSYDIISLKFAFFDFVARQILSNLHGCARAVILRKGLSFPSGCFSSTEL